MSIEFHLLGYAYRPLDSAVHVHGAYDEAALQYRMRALEPDLIWFPCQWPETYSYTLTSTLESGLPLLAPSLGAFSSRTEGRPFSWVYDFDKNSAQLLSMINSHLNELVANSGETRIWDNQKERPAYYSNDVYLPKRIKRDFELDGLPSEDALEDILYKNVASNQSRIRALLAPLLWRLRNSRLVSRIWFGLVPGRLRVGLRKILIGNA